MEDILLKIFGVLFWLYILIRLVEPPSKKSRKKHIESKSSRVDAHKVKHVVGEKYDSPPVSPDIYAWDYMFLLAILLFVLSVALSVISWIYYGFLAGLGVLAGCLLMGYFLLIDIIDSDVFMKFVHWRFDRERRKSRR